MSFEKISDLGWRSDAAADSLPPLPCADCHLRALCLPAKLSPSEAALLDRTIEQRRRVRRQAPLFTAGERIKALYVVRTGQFKLTYTTRWGAQRVMGFPMPSELIGTDAIATGYHGYSCVALEDAEVCELPYSRLSDAMSAQAGVHYHFMRAISHAIASQSGGPAVRDSLRVDQRFAAFLLEISTRRARLGQSISTFQLSMSRGDISSYLGIRVESVSRLLGRFRDKGWLGVSQRDIELRDRAGLEALLCEDSS